KSWRTSKIRTALRSLKNRNARDRAKACRNQKSRNWIYYEMGSSVPPACHKCPGSATRVHADSADQSKDRVQGLTRRQPTRVSYGRNHSGQAFVQQPDQGTLSAERGQL